MKKENKNLKDLAFITRGGLPKAEINKKAIEEFKARKNAA